MVPTISQKQNGNGLKLSIANIIVLLVLVAGVAASWGDTRSSLGSYHKKVDGLENKIDAACEEQRDTREATIKAAGDVENLSKELLRLSGELSSTRQEIIRLREAIHAMD